MSTPSQAEFEVRAKQALEALERMPELQERVWADVDGFYARNTGIKRTPVGEAFIASLVIERLSLAAPAATQPQENKQAA